MTFSHLYLSIFIMIVIKPVTLTTSWNRFLSEGIIGRRFSFLPWLCFYNLRLLLSILNPYWLELFLPNWGSIRFFPFFYPQEFGTYLPNWDSRSFYPQEFGTSLPNWGSVRLFFFIYPQEFGTSLLNWGSIRFFLTFFTLKSFEGGTYNLKWKRFFSFFYPQEFGTSLPNWGSKKVSPFFYTQ